MSTSIEGRTPSLPPPVPPRDDGPAQAPWPIRFLCTSNPFYVISAGLFLAGLWISCDPEKAEDTWALMAGLLGYTLLLAATAFLLIRFAKVWDDARTVLLLVVLMFLATSVTFDRTVVFAARFPEQRHFVPSWLWNVAGLVIAIVISEALLHGLNLGLPAWYRAPYYALLALFFLYPIALIPILETDARGEPMQWALFLFPSVAALIFLTLLPAVWRGGAYVENNGSPWPWPLYPWSLFALLAFAVPCRAILLCYSMHLIDVRDLYEMTFGFYFLTPLVLVLAVLLLEAGRTSGREGLVWTALAIPLGMIVLTTLGHADNPTYANFLEVFEDRLGIGPLWFTLLLASVFYAYAAMRWVPYALEALAAVLSVTMMIESDALDFQLENFTLPHPALLMLVSWLLLGLGIWRRSSWHCLLGGIGIAAALTLAIPLDTDLAPYRWPIAYHLVLLVAFLVAAIFDDELAHVLRFLAAFVAMLVGLASMLFPTPPALPDWIGIVYPPAIALVLLGFGLVRWNLAVLTMAGGLFLAWSLLIGASAYRTARQRVIGLDYLVLSFAVFAIALSISLWKAGLFTRWRAAWRTRAGGDTLD